MPPKMAAQSESSASVQKKKRPTTSSIACENCRAKKLRCNYTSPACGNCVKHSLECRRRDAPVKTGSRRNHVRQIQKLEERLREMEKVVMKGRIPKEGLSQHQDLGEGKEVSRAGFEFNEIRGNNFTNPVMVGIDYDSLPAWNEDLPYMWDFYKDVLDDTVPSQAIQPAVQNEEHIMDASTSELSARPSNTPALFFDGPTENISVEASVYPFQNFDKKFHLYPGIYREILPCKETLPLPPYTEALPIIRRYFLPFNTTLPLFSPTSFLTRLQTDYPQSLSHTPDPKWWTCINVVLAICHRFLAMDTHPPIPTSPSRSNSLAFAYLKNALSQVPQLTLESVGIPHIQALLGMALVLQGTPNPHAASALAASAMRQAQHLGLHRETYYHTSAASRACARDSELEQQRKLFWVAYWLDKDISLRTEKPPVHHDEDMDVQLPSPATGPEALTLLHSSTSIDIFAYQIRLAQIKGRIYRRLYSASATFASSAELVCAARELRDELEAWKRSFPVEFEAEGIGEAVPEKYLMEVLVVYSGYYQGSRMVQRVADARLKDMPKRGDDLGERRCMKGHRRSLKMLSLAPRGDFCVNWLILSSLVSATIAVLENVIRCERESMAECRSDLQLVDPLLKLLDLLANGHGSENAEVQQVRDYCQGLARRASNVVTEM